MSQSVVLGVENDLQSVDWTPDFDGVSPHPRSRMLRGGGGGRRVCSVIVHQKPDPSPDVVTVSEHILLV